MITTERERQDTLLCMCPDGLGDGLTDFGDETRVFELADVGIARDGCGNVFELVVAVKLDLPAELFELIDEASIHEMDGSPIDTSAGLKTKIVRHLDRIIGYGDDVPGHH